MADFLHVTSGQLNMFRYSAAMIDFDEKLSVGPEVFKNPKKRPFQHRKSYNKRNPRVYAPGNSGKNPAIFSRFFKSGPAGFSYFRRDLIILPYLASCL